MKFSINGKIVSIPDPNHSVPNAPIGCIVAWSGTVDDIPVGWHICDGEDGTLDLRDKFILGAGSKYSVGSTGGSEKVTLTVDQMPEHKHAERMNNADTIMTSGNFSVPLVNGTIGGYYVDRNSIVRISDGKGVRVNTDMTGSSQPHPNMPPYYALLFIQKISDGPTDYATRDYVDEKIKDQNFVEEYDSSGWHVRQWSNGYIEMSGIFSETVASDLWTTWGQIYVVSAGKLKTHQYPMPLRVKYSEQHTVGCTGGAATGSISGNIGLLDKTGQYGLIRGTSVSGSMTIIRSFFITGMASQTKTAENLDSITEEVALIDSDRENLE